ncbi:MAG: hypothetical protein Q4P18_07850 [Methanobrevibacter sp.]|uniref:hypothetical protein n=1 Tax=Methanobrevibacter sp. TaxID=66852 RepID=UPI0026DF4B4B|nr:hypothetical protein [Methanobrevibacter sp.]MDO5849433.1 hypothetical protein [Methanobrevibacter sp.]
MKIIFKDFKIKEGRIDFKIEGDDLDGSEIYFDLSEDIIPSNDSIAYSIATLAGEKYDKMIIEDLTVSPSVKKNIEEYASATVTVEIGEEAPKKEKENFTLNFSGGFDSLATYTLMPENTELVYLEFGGDFEREVKFFKRFNPYRVKTNLVTEGFNRNTEEFMGIGTLLYSDYLNTGYTVFGTIMKPNYMFYVKNPNSDENLYEAPFNYHGIKTVKYAQALTEIGTAMVVSHHFPELVEDSFESLAPVGSEKYFRKGLILDTVNKKFNRNLNISPDFSHVKYKMKWGRSLNADFISLYLIKNGCLDYLNKLYLHIPKEAIEFVDDLDLNLYERVNTTFMEKTFPSKDALSKYLTKLNEAGVIPFTEKDYDEFRKVADFLDKYHYIYAHPKNEVTTDNPYLEGYINLNKSYLDLNNSYSELNNKNMALKKEHNALRKNYSDLHKEFIEFKKDHYQGIKNYENEIENLNNIIDSYRSRRVVKFANSFKRS